MDAFVSVPEKDSMKEFICIILVVMSFLIGAISHERDMFNNLKRTGDAFAWTCDIRSREMMENMKSPARRF
ncbi:MAG TPA: hypothetical protein DCS42_00420 [Nitrospiraceae bacterium]|nr:hypothetical protein [Nitrospiraceae bacterium]